MDPRGEQAESSGRARPALVGSTHRASEVNQLLPHLRYQGLLGHQGPVQTLVELNQLPVHLGDLQRQAGGYGQSGAALPVLKPGTTALCTQQWHAAFLELGGSGRLWSQDDNVGPFHLSHTCTKFALFGSLSYAC